MDNFLKSLTEQVEDTMDYENNKPSDPEVELDEMGLSEVESLLESPELRIAQVFERLMVNEEPRIEVCALGESRRD